MRRLTRKFAVPSVKALLRKADTRSIEDVEAVLGVLLDDFEPDESARYLSAAGYRSTSG